MHFTGERACLDLEVGRRKYAREITPVKIGGDNRSGASGGASSVRRPQVLEILLAAFYVAAKLQKRKRRATIERLISAANTPDTLCLANEETPHDSCLFFVQRLVHLQKTQ